MIPDDGWRGLIESIRALERREVEIAARRIRSRCRQCWTELHHKGYCAPGGISVILTTCPRCDRYDERNDR